MSKKKKILILGVTGQDGSFMARLMLEKKYFVHGLVRKSATGNLANIENLMHLRWHLRASKGAFLTLAGVLQQTSKIVIRLVEGAIEILKL